MKLYEPISQDSIIDEINRICGTTNEVYSNRLKISRVNQALDRYWKIVSDTAPKGTFDDTGRTSAPIETQNLVDGTNTYKISDFTNEVLQILKIAILKDDGETEIDLIHEEFDDYNEFLQWYSTDVADKGEPTHWTVMGDYIYLRPTPNYSETNGLRAYINRVLSRYTYTTFTVTIASPAVFTATGHGLSSGDGILLVTDGALPTGLTTDTTIYYVDKIDADTFKVSTTPSDVGSTNVNTSGSQSGTHQFVKVSRAPGIPSIHHDYIARYASMPFLSEKKLPQLNTIGQRIAEDELSIQEYWYNRLREYRTVIIPRRRVFR